MHFPYTNPTPTGAPHTAEARSWRSPSLADHRRDLHVLLDAVPGFPSRIADPLPLLHGQRELSRPFRAGAQRLLQRVSSRPAVTCPRTFPTPHRTLLASCARRGAGYTRLRLTGTRPTSIEPSHRQAAPSRLWALSPTGVVAPGQGVL